MAGFVVGSSRSSTRGVSVRALTTPSGAEVSPITSTAPSESAWVSGTTAASTSPSRTMACASSTLSAGTPSSDSAPDTACWAEPTTATRVGSPLPPRPPFAVRKPLTMMEARIPTSRIPVLMRNDLLRRRMRTSRPVTSIVDWANVGAVPGRVLLVVLTGRPPGRSR